MGRGNDNRRLTPLDDESMRDVLESLIDWRIKSDPARGSSSEIQKHYNAQQTIFFTGLLVESLCAWAFDLSLLFNRSKVILVSAVPLWRKQC